MPDFFNRLVLQRKALIFVLLSAYMMAIAGGLCLGILILEGLNRWTPLQEQTAFISFVLLFLAGSILSIIGVIRLLLKRPTLPQLAAIVEQKHPELMESLISAVEILGRKKDFEHTPLEAALIRKVEQDTASINFTTTILPQKLHPILMIVLGISVAVFSDFAVRAEVTQKAAAYLKDIAQNQNTGMAVKPGDVEVPIGSDLIVEVEVYRWERDPHVVYKEDGKLQKYPMFMNAEGIAEFTFYGISEPLSYHVETSSLQSNHYTITAYQPPEIERIQINIIPPRYTGEENRSFEQFVDLFVTEGSVIEFQLQAKTPVDYQLKSQESERQVDSTFSIAPLEDTDYQLILTDAQGRKFVSDTYIIEVAQDEPPVIEIVDPGRDTNARPDDVVPLEIYTADDYGISRVELSVSVSGLYREPVVIYDGYGEPTREQNFLSVIEMQLQAVEHGDILSYYATVWDNKEPQAQSSKSEIFFIEISKEIKPEDSDGPSGGGEGEQEEVDLRALIVELKRLIRLNHATLPLDGELRELNRQELGTGIAALQNEAQEILSKVGSTLAQVENGEILRIFQNSIQRITDAERAVNEDDLIAAIPSKEEALSDFLKVESYLKSQSPPSQGQGQGQQQSQSQKDESGQKSEGKAMSLSEMKEALEDINRLLDSQSEMNAKTDRAERANASNEEAEELQKLQEGIREKTEALGRELRTQQDTRDTGNLLRMATQEMGQGSQALSEQDFGRAGRSGARAKESLMNAANQLDNQIRQAASQAVQSLSQAAGSLASKEQSAAEASEGAAGGKNPGVSKESLREEQAQIEQMYEQLMKELDNTAFELEALYPEAGQALSEAARVAEKNRTQNEMKRASNALLYEKFKRAAKHQSKAADAMQQLAQSIDSAAGKMPAMSQSELRSLLEQVLQARQEAQQSGKSEGSVGKAKGQSEQASGDEGEQGQIQKMLSELGDTVSRAGEMLKNTDLAKLGQEMKAPEGETGGGDSGVNARKQAALDQAARLIQQYLNAEWVEDRVRVNRRSGPPPEKYRQLVEEYFKTLAEEP